MSQNIKVKLVKGKKSLIMDVIDISINKSKKQIKDKFIKIDSVELF